MAHCRNRELQPAACRVCEFSGLKCVCERQVLPSWLCSALLHARRWGHPREIYRATAVVAVSSPCCEIQRSSCTNSSLRAVA
jgi:hypothetical protein